MEKKDFVDMYPGFNVTCQKCGSPKVYIENDIGYSHLSGAWGSIDLICSECQNRTSIVEA